MQPAAVVALAYRYPTPNALERLDEAVQSLPRGSTRRSMEKYLSEVGALDLGQWEELHTETLDLSPHFVPYVGHVAWGENYRRGEFMADLKRDMERHDVDQFGELPDHIEPVLRYLAQVPRPLTDLTDVLVESVVTMQATLDKASPGNPYRHVLAATLSVVEEPTPVVIGLRR